jgi:prolyl oligopeptidase
MIRSTLRVAAFAGLLGGSALAAQPLQYPQARRVPHQDTISGTVVEDPYRWLEDTDSPETRSWIESENQLTERFLAAIPERAAIRTRLTELWNYPRAGAPFKKGGRRFTWRNDGLQNQSVLYVEEGSRPARVLLDPNTLRADGTESVGSLAVSEDGSLLAYSVSSGGSDWQQFRVREVASGRDLPDTIRWAKFSGASWTHDGRGFFYSRYPEPTGNALTSTVRNQKLYYHRLGTPQSQDVLVYERPDEPDFGFGGEVSEDGRYLVTNVWKGTDRRNRIHVMDLGDARSPRLDGPMVRLLDAFDASYGFVGNRGSVRK